MTNHYEQADVVGADDFDPFSAATRARAPKALAELARRAPVHHYRGAFDFFIQSDPDYITEVMFKDSDQWTSEFGVSPTDMPAEWQTRMLQEGPAHGQIRMIIQRGFSPRQLRRLAVAVERIVEDLLDAMSARREASGDFFTLFAMPLPARLMCVMLGTPERDHLFYKDWADRFFYMMNNQPGLTSEDYLQQTREIGEKLFRLIGERKATLEAAGLDRDVARIGHELPDDFLSRFLCETIDGEHLPEVEILSLMTAIILGGNETTMNLIGNLLWRLLEDRTRWERVCADPALIEVAIEESLRLDPPTLGMVRSARHDIVFDHLTIPAGAKTFYNVSAVNRDPDRWEQPDEFRLDRPLGRLKHHASFCGGTRFCLGASLARMEVKLAFERILARFPKMRIAGEAKIAPGFNVWGKTELPVRWD